MDIREDVGKGLKMGYIKVEQKRKRNKLANKFTPENILMGDLLCFVQEQVQEALKEQDFSKPRLRIIRLRWRIGQLWIGNTKIQLPWPVVCVHDDLPKKLEKRFGMKFANVSDAREEIDRQLLVWMADYDKMSEQDVCPHTDGTKHHVWNMVMLLMRRSQALEKMEELAQQKKDSITPSTEGHAPIFKV